MALKIVGSVDIKIQMKPKSGEFAQDFSKTVDNCLPCLLSLDFMIDQECTLDIGEHLLYSTKHFTALPISEQTTTGARAFAKAERNSRISAEKKNQKKLSSRGRTVPSSVAQTV